MPWFTLNRNYALSTTKGHSVNFKKGEKTWVPKLIVQEALAIGAICEEQLDVLPETKEQVAVTDADRKKNIFAAFEKLLLRNNRGDFSASGHPHPKKLEDVLGFDVPAKEREILWIEYNANKVREEEENR